MLFSPHCIWIAGNPLLACFPIFGGQFNALRELA